MILRAVATRRPEPAGVSARSIQARRRCIASVECRQRKCGRAVEGTGLENRQWATIRGFESHRFRHRIDLASAGDSSHPADAVESSQGERLLGPVLDQSLFELPDREFVACLIFRELLRIEARHVEH